MRNQIDEIDLVALIVLPLAAGIELGVWTLSLDVFGGFDFGQALLSLGSVDISIAFIATMASIAALVAQGQLSQDDYQEEEWYIIAGSMAIVPLYVFVPLVQTLVEMSDIIPLVVWLALSVASVYISYKA
mgnify:CR=1 FL=1